MTSGKRAASIWDVARAAGVSQQTVSRVINGNTRVSEPTRAKVLRTIDELGYRPNRLARALAGGPVRAVTVLTSDTSLYGPSATLRGMEKAARAAGFAFGIVVLERSPTARETPDRPGEAVMVIAYDAPGVRALRALPPDLTVTAVVERPTDSGDDDGHVWLDDRAAAAQATRHLLSLGHRSVHYLAIPSSAGAVAPRTEGWREAMEAAGKQAPEPLQGGWTPRSGYLAARSLLDDPSVTAVLCGNDDLALGVMRAARELGRAVPGDLSVVGFDDSPAAAYLNPSLTTVRLDFEGMGRACFERLHRRLDPEGAPPVTDWDEPTLVLRESSGPRSPQERQP